MPTIAIGNLDEVYVPVDSSVAITPGSGGVVRLGTAVLQGMTVVAPQEIRASATISVAGGSTLFLEAVGANGSYAVTVSGGSGTVDAASVQAALSSDQAGGRTALGLGTAATQASTAFASNTEVATFADLPAASSVTAGRVYTVLGNITGTTGGAFGTQWASNGTIWRPAGGQVLWHLVAQADGVAGGTTTEQLLISSLFPARVFAGCRAIAFRSRWTASGTDANARTLRWRVGTAGNSTDAAVQTWTAFAGANRVAIFPAHLSPAGTTGLLATNFPTASASPDAQGGSNTASSAAITVPDMSSNSLYVSATVTQGASPTATISLERAWIYVE